MSVLSSIVDALVGLPINDVLRERLFLIKEQAERLEIRNAELEAEVSRLMKENERLAAKNHKASAVAEKFVECRGALFQRIPGTRKVEAAVFCPWCRRSASPFEGNQLFSCDRCEWYSSFTINELDAVLKEAEKR